ncbi:MAG: outer membrane beta-barrel protein [Pseudobacteriovorax sp.]|nr:outer membrane beta-barrel protein [Pseudobacteriovorax sp.]
MKKIITIIAATMVSATAFSQVEPVDKNKKGVYAGGSLRFGQSFQAGTGSSGATFGAAGEFGVILPRDSWNRIEIGGEFGTTSLGFKDESGEKVTVDALPVALVKFGYGYSLGNHAFGMFRLGAGLGVGELEQGDFTTDATALVGLIGWDAVFPATDHLDFTVGVDYRMHDVSLDSANGVDFDNIQVNSVNVFASARLKI